MDVIPGYDVDNVNIAVSTEATPTPTIKSNGWLGFKRIMEMAAKNIQRVVTPTQSSKVLLWARVMISNAKRNLLGIYHKTKDVCLQNYQNEFCYKTNPRLFHADLFEHLLVSAFQYTKFRKQEYKKVKSI